MFTDLEQGTVFLEINILLAQTLEIDRIQYGGSCIDRSLIKQMNLTCNN